MKNLVPRLTLAFSCCLTFLTGCIFIPFAGIQMDEALFSRPYYQPVQREFRLRVFHHDIPLMVMTYIGTLKTLLYWPLMAIFRSGFEAHPGRAAWVFRLPTVLTGALTVFVFFYLAQRAAGRPVAVAATLLLSSDPTFLLTNTFDWGPVALEHLLLVTGLFFLVKFAQDGVERDLPLGFFFLGLALWNKAVFVWAIAGLLVGGLLVFWREVSKLTSGRHFAIASAAFLAGALPFVLYNGHRRAETFRTTAHLEPRAAPGKFIQLRHALSGSGLYGYMVAEEWTDSPKAARSLPGRAAVFLRDHLGEHRDEGMEYAALLAVLAVPLWWHSRAARFSLLFTAAAWFFMASTRDAGASVHHTVLLWPFPQLFVAIVACSLRSKWVAIPICGLLVVLNLLTLTQYISQFARNGAEGPFSDAIYPLSAAVSAIPGQTIYLLDWGIQFPLEVLHDGHLRMRSGHDSFQSDTPSDADQAAALKVFADPGALFITHTGKRENFSGVHQRFDESAARAGCREDNVRTIPDSNGRAVFEMFQLRCGAR